MSTTILLLVGLIFVSLAAQHVGRVATRARLPLITGYLAAGAMVGPFILGWITRDSVHALRFVDHTALAFIAFAAGNELNLKEVRSQLRNIAWTTVWLVLATFTLGCSAVLLLAEHISFLAPLPTNARIAVALMAASILVARSPSSAIAIITELRARGPFTKTALGVTVVMDAVVILLFATASSISQSLVAGADFDPWFILRVVLDLLVSLNLGYITGKLLQVVVSAQTSDRVKSALVLALGLGAFWLSHSCREFSETRLSLAITPEPLLVCMIAGFVVTNFSRFRAEFASALFHVAPLVYLIFFTLVGASLALDALVKLWHIALILFAVRLLGIVSGSVTGGLFAHAKTQHVRLGWMAYITQAGVGLGLAKDVAAQFPAFGGAFATMIISIIVLSQIIGPPLLKFAIKRVGESHLPSTASSDEIRDALIVGVDDQAVALARQLRGQGWKVVLVDTDAANVEHAASDGLEAHHVARIDEKSLAPHITRGTDALVAMLDDDDDNLAACELGFEKYGIPRLIVRLNDLSYSDRFEQLKARVVEPASAVLSLMDQFVRIPELADLVLHRDPHHQLVQVTIADPDVAGQPLRELRLPPEVRVLGITRDGHPIVPQPATTLRRHDEVTLVGEPAQVEALVNRWGY